MLLVGSTAYADGRTLEPQEVKERLKSIDAQIERCYLDTVGDRAGAGHLDITFDIHRTGIVDKITIATPNLPAKLSTKIDGCVRALVKDIGFPARKAGVIATVPYFYQKTAAKDAGPQESCWSAAGCKADGTPRDVKTTKSTATRAVQARRAKS